MPRSELILFYAVGMLIQMNNNGWLITLGLQSYLPVLSLLILSMIGGIQAVERVVLVRDDPLYFSELDSNYIRKNTCSFSKLSRMVNHAHWHNICRCSLPAYA